MFTQSLPLDDDDDDASSAVYFYIITQVLSL